LTVRSRQREPKSRKRLPQSIGVQIVRAPKSGVPDEARSLLQNAPDTTLMEASVPRVRIRLGNEMNCLISLASAYRAQRPSFERPATLALLTEEGDTVS